MSGTRRSRSLDYEVGTRFECHSRTPPRRFMATMVKGYIWQLASGERDFDTREFHGYQRRLRALRGATEHEERHCGGQKIELPKVQEIGPRRGRRKTQRGGRRRS